MACFPGQKLKVTSDDWYEVHFAGLPRKNTTPFWRQSNLAIASNKF
jgi:hypothetical protein